MARGVLLSAAWPGTGVQNFTHTPAPPTAHAQVIYDLNDFDESFVANFLYDMYRMATSIVLVAWENNLSNSTVS